MSHFDRPRAYGCSVHYWHLQLWALEASNMVGLNNFRDSNTCINNLNAEYGISSRNITTFITSEDIKEDHNIRQKANDFVEEVNRSNRGECGKGK